MVKRTSDGQLTNIFSLTMTFLNYKEAV